MEPRRYLRCLGQPELFAANGEPIKFRTKKHLALLVFLAVESRRPHRRDRLAEFLWPNARIAEARHSLATALSILRPRLGPGALETTRDRVSLPAGRVVLDLDRLLNGDVVGQDIMVPLDVNAFLDGFDISDAPEFGLWKDRQQARLIPALRNALAVVLDRCRRTCDTKQLEQLADRMLLLDELSEEGIRAKMEARAWGGDRLSALKLFEDWKERLFEELQASPSAQVEQMATRMRRGGWERTLINDIPVVSPDRSRERPFVGRAEEYLRLYEAWEGLKQGKAIHSVVLGDSGVGKTTLVERLTIALGLEGAAVARVQAYDLERNIPFATLGSLILGLLNMPGVSATPPEALAELARTVPDIRRRFPTLPASAPSNGETARIRLTESFLQLLHAVAEEHPVILVVDDLHLADEPSLAVLHLALRRAIGEPILAVFTGRPAELGRSTQAALLRESLCRLKGQEVVLAPLAPPQCLELLAALREPDDPKLSDTVQRSLIRASGGFPMVLELLVQDWRTNGSRSVAIALEAMTAEFVNGADPGAAYGHILSRLSGTVGPAAKSALHLASVLGPRLNDLSLYSVIDLTLGQTMSALGQLREARVLRDGQNGLEFANELIRAHVYSSLSSPVRKALHASVADRLQHVGEPHERPPHLEIAWHRMRAGRTDEAIPYLLEGATDAIRSGAPQSAERALFSALASLQGDDLVKATILLVEALQEQGRWRESLDVIATLEGVAADGKSQEAFALAALAKGYLGTPMEEWLEFLPALKNIMETCPHVLSRIRAARAVAHATSHMRDRTLACEMLTVVDGLPLSELDADARSHLGLARALLLFQAGDMEASYQHASALLEELRDRGLANSVVAQFHTGLGAIRGRQGRYAEATLHHERALRLALLLGNDTLTAQICANLALCYGRLGRYEDQLQCASSSPKPHANDPLTFTDVHLTSSVAFAHGVEGRLSKMREVIDSFEKRLGPHVPRSVTQSWYLWKADILAVAGLREEAWRSAHHAVGEYQMKLECRALAGTFARWAAVTCSGTSEHQQARELLDYLDDHLDDYDALDQVDILCAKMHCGWGEAREYRERIARRLEKLPEPALAPLIASGIAVGG
jgi:DNA-binding SARP family transcriptional activator/tetratricopeptide (TPR) repeat protein